MAYHWPADTVFRDLTLEVADRRLLALCADAQGLLSPSAPLLHGGRPGPVAVQAVPLPRSGLLGAYPDH